MKRRWWVLIGVLLVVIIGIFFLLRMVNGPAVGSIKGPPPPPPAAPDPAKTFLNYEGQHITFTYPGTYEKIKSQANPQQIESVNLLGTVGAQSKELVAAVRQIGLSEHPSVRLRRLQRSQYKEEAIDGGVLFTKTTGFERAAFLTRDGLVTSLVLTEGNGHDLSGEFEQVLQSFKWTDR